MNRQYRMVNRKVEPEKAPFPSPRFLLAMVLLAIVGFGFYKFASYMIADSGMFVLKEIKITGNQYVDEKDILKRVMVDPGTRLFEVQTDSVEQRILRNPYFSGVSVSRSLPSTLIIAVQEREAVAYLVDRSIYMVATDGKILLKKPRMSFDRLPLITGLNVAGLLKNRQPLLDALQLIDKIHQVDETLFSYISEVHISRDEPPCLFLVRGGARVNLHSKSQYQGLYVLSEFIKMAAVRNQLETIKKIELNFANRIVVTRKS